MNINISKNLKQLLINDLEKNPFIKLNNRLKQTLDNLYYSIIKSADPFLEYETKQISKILNEIEKIRYKKINLKDISRYLKFSFDNLGDLVEIKLPTEVSQELKFNIFTALFLKRISEEKIYSRFVDLTDKELLQHIKLAPYSLINNEIEENYQSLPVLFYFTIFSKRLEMFPALPQAKEFVIKIKTILDLSQTKNLNKITAFLTFSKSIEDFYIEWTEYDSLDSNDNKSYPDQKMRVFTFAQKVYLKIPGSNLSPKIEWLQDLCNADSGNIELNDFIVRNQALFRSQFIKKIFYSPTRTQFTVLLKESIPEENPDFIQKVFIRKYQEYQSKHEIVANFPINKDDAIVIERLRKFGIFLKKKLFKAIDP